MTPSQQAFNSVVIVRYFCMRADRHDFQMRHLIKELLKLISGHFVITLWHSTKICDNGPCNSKQKNDFCFREDFPLGEFNKGHSKLIKTKEKIGKMKTKMEIK